VPGFEPQPGIDARLSGRLTDPARKALLARIYELNFSTWLNAIDRRLEQIKTHPSGADEEERSNLRVRRVRLMQIKLEDDKKGDGALVDLLEPALVGMSLCERLREEGATSAARKLAERIRDDLGRSHGALSDIELERAMARAETALGSALMDENSPGEADTVLTSALTRLEAIAGELAKQNNTQGAALIRSQTANVLVSLAVNANVKLRQPEKAVAYFERAYALEQNDFMRVLLACYRARAGRSAEARAALRDVPVSPANYYNLGCTWALLGERELALDFLKRDFDELRSSGGSRERQKQWAKSDPDLDSLRDDPRFQALVRPAESTVK
jgi:tetratricopeptide (TPR) repeat protein